MLNVRTRPITLALLGLALCLPAAAQWKWRDAEGRVLYSDRPPPLSVPAKDILQSPTAAAPRIQVISSVPLGASAPEQLASKPAAKAELNVEAEARRRKLEQEQAAKVKAEEQKNAAARKENCTQARSYLRTLEDGRRVARTNEKGEREILDDKQRAHEIERARAVVASDCV